MAFSNYTLADLAGSLIATAMFFPVLFVPGYLAGWLTNCFGFRQLDPRWRGVLSVPLSMAVCPALMYWCATFVGWSGVSVLFLAFFAYWLWLMVGKAGHERWSIWFKHIRALPKGVWLAGFAWSLIALGSLVDLQLGNRLYFSATAYDHSVRTAVTETIARVGSHPNNPFYYLTGPVPLRYHYFWLLPCGFLAHVLGGLASARTCIYASAIWCGWGFMALIPSAFRFLLGFYGAALRSRTYLALAFTAVTGLDLLPTAYFYHLGTVYPDMEWWNNIQITSWWGSALWVPHHFAALVIGMTGFLICWDARTATDRRRLISCGLLGGFAFGSLVGTSVYVAVVIAAFLGVWTGIVLVRREARQLLVLAIAGCLAIAIAVPYLHSLSGKGEGGPFMRLSPRHSWPVDEFAAAHDISGVPSQLLRLLATPFNYFAELGFFFVVGVVFLWKLKGKRTSSPGLQATVLLAGISVFISTFFRSGVISMNDLGIRGFLPAQFVLLLWAAELFSPPGPQTAHTDTGARGRLWNWGWILLLVFGVAGTLYQASMLRVHGMLADRGLVRPWFASDRQLGERTYALRKAYETAKARLATDAVIQNNPKRNDDVYFGLYSDRQTAAFDSTCGAEFGGDPNVCALDLPVLAELFAEPNAFDLKRATAVCNRLKIRALVVKDKDGIWGREPAWLQRLPVLIENAHVRIIEIPADQSGEGSSARAAQASTDARDMPKASDIGGFRSTLLN